MRHLLKARGEWRWLLDAVGSKALPALGKCLSGPVLRNLALTGRSEYLAGALVETGFANAIGLSSTVGDALRAIFDLLRNAYRCDYVYRAAITNKLFLGRHSPATTTLLSELRVWRSKADLAMFNGTSIAYEIKTELDNVDRLDSQLRDYSSMFDRIFVVTHDDRLASIRPVIPPHVGILVLGRSLSFRVEREALSNADRVHPRTIADALRRDEVLEVTRRVTGSVPSATRVALIDACTSALASCSPREVHDAMVAVLKRRICMTREDVSGVAPELVSAYMETGLRPDTWQVITERLTQRTLGDVITDYGEVFSVPARQDV